MIKNTIQKKEFFTNNFFAKNRKGVSAIVTTVIMLALVLIAVGVVWAVISGIIGENVEETEWGQKCTKVNLAVDKMVNPASDDYSLTLSRTGTGDVVNGVKAVFFNATDNSAVLDDSTGLSPLETTTLEFVDTLVLEANKVEVTPYFTDESGTEHTCSTVTKTF